METQENILRNGGTARQLQARTDHPEDLGSIPRIHTVAQNHLELQFQGIQSPLLVSSNTRHMCGETDIHEGKTPIATSVPICKHLDLTGEGREGRNTEQHTERTLGSDRLTQKLNVFII